MKKLTKEQESLSRDVKRIVTYQLDVLIASCATFYMTIYFAGYAIAETNVIYGVLAVVMLGMSWFVQMAWEPDTIWDNYESN